MTNIIEFDTQQKAQTCLAVINQLAAAYWAGEGYKIIDTPEGKAVVGKNALTGDDMLDSAKTITWDTVKTSPDGTFYFIDPATNDKFSLWMERATTVGYKFDGIQKEAPSNWS